MRGRYVYKRADKIATPEFIGIVVRLFGGYNIIFSAKHEFSAVFGFYALRVPVYIFKSISRI